MLKVIDEDGVKELTEEVTRFIEAQLKLHGGSPDNDPNETISFEIRILRLLCMLVSRRIKFIKALPRILKEAIEETGIQDFEISDNEHYLAQKKINKVIKDTIDLLLKSIECKEEAKCQQI